MKQKILRKLAFSEEVGRVCKEDYSKKLSPRLGEVSFHIIPFLKMTLARGILSQ